MKGYLMQEKEWIPGEDLFLESFSPESRMGVVFEDDGDTAYFYAVEKDEEGNGLRVLDALFIYQTDESPDGNLRDQAADMPNHSPVPPESSGPNPQFQETGETSRASKLLIIWSRDWMKCALVVDGYCHALFDFSVQGGYNIKEFPPPNDFWTRGARKLTDDLVRDLF
jgi:hypothetical protein